MMKISSLILLLALPITLNAESLFEKGIEPGYYFGPTAQFSSVNGKGVALLGLEAAFLANAEWALGIAGSTLLTNTEFKTGIASDSIKRIEMNYLGVKLGYVSNPSWLIHWTFGTLIGGGTARYTTPDDAKLPGYIYSSFSDKFFVVEPEFGAEINLTDYLRLYSGISYRWIAWADNYYGVDSIDLSSVGVKFALRFGKMALDPTDKRTKMKW